MNLPIILFKSREPSVRKLNAWYLHVPDPMHTECQHAYITVVHLL
jgi:hypothetical protein